jgi:superfamily I DNA/RNA helicase
LPANTLSDDREQEAILADDSRRLLITAPPGSGKTVTAVRLAARDVDGGFVGSTQRVLVLTFSLQARAQLEAYAKDLLTPEQRKRIEITNYHAWFRGKVWQLRSSLGLPLELDLTTDAQHQRDVLSAMIKAGVATADARWDDTARDYGLALEYGVAGCRPERLDEPLPDAAEVTKELIQIHRAGRVYYDDLAYYMWRLVDESEILRRIWRHKYPVVILDEYQDTSPMQAKIVERLFGDAGRIYAFADPLQMIYGWRDASPKRVSEFKDRGASPHELKTLHRYKHRPDLRDWMEGVRDVLLASGGTCPPPPADVDVVSYDPSRRIRSEPYDIASRDLWQLDRAVSDALQTNGIESIGILHRKYTHLERVERHLSQKFFCKRLRTARDTAEWAREWVEQYPIATSEQLKMEQLMQVARRVAPRNEDLQALSERIDIDGIRVDRLGDRRRDLGTALNEALSLWTDLSGACEAARTVGQIAVRHEQDKLIAGDAAYVVRTALRVRTGIGDAEAKERIVGRITQLRFTTEARYPRGVYLMTCHEAKGKEFDMVILPYVSAQIFPEEKEEARQLLYVSLTRARHKLFVRVAKDQAPAYASAMGLTG